MTLVSSELGTIIDSWGLTGKVNFSVSDNGANIVKAMKEYQGWKQFGCFAHTVNLIVEDALKICHKLTEKVKKIVAHLKRSSISSERLARYQLQQNKEPKRPLQDVETRWNSKYYMLKRMNNYVRCWSLLKK